MGIFDGLSKAMSDMGVTKKSAPKNKTNKSVLEHKLTTAQKTNVLSLTEHELEEIPCRVYQIVNLRTLDLSKNKIRSLGKLSVLKELKSLNCDDNLLTNASELSHLGQISNLTNLQTLSLGRNKIKYPTRAISDDGKFAFTLPPKLKQLRLNGNEFASIPKQILAPINTTTTTTTLEKLDMSYNNLAYIPIEIGNLTSLTELLLDNNVITSLPNEMGKLTKLKTLSMRNNYIQLPSTTTTKSGTTNYFSSNNPQPIPSSIFINTLLVDLNLHGNKLTSTQLNEFDGFDTFLERRRVVKTKGLIGGAMDGDSTLCGLK